MDGNIIGNKIKELRIAKNVTQEELASRVNVAKATISAYENGSPPSLLHCPRKTFSHFSCINR